MPTLILNLRDVPDDEAEEVRELMRENQIEFYETPPNRWGISAGGIWIRGDDDAARAKTLFDAYQRQRAHAARVEHERQKHAGEAETFWGLLKRQPLKMLFVAGLALGLLVLLAFPIWQLAR